MSAMKIKSLSLAANPARVRQDIWVRLRRNADRLAEAQSSGLATNELAGVVAEDLAALGPYEKYWLFPSESIFATLCGHLEGGEYEALASQLRVVEHHVSNSGDRACLLGGLEELSALRLEEVIQGRPHYFTVLMASTLPPGEQCQLQEMLKLIQLKQDDFVYQLLNLDNVIDAIVAALFNYEVQACVIQYDVPLGNLDSTDVAGAFFAEYFAQIMAGESDRSTGLTLAHIIHEIRPHLDLYLLTDESVSDQPTDTHRIFDRVFYSLDVPSELHMTILEGVRRRYRTPFFDALKANAAEPIGNFHALPIARGNSIFNSRWIGDMADFYGPDIFMAETSSTTGGLDSLLAPTGTIKEAQDKASETWGSQRTYFATNGTSTSNKVVLQALTRPGDIVLIDRNCHKSHHYGMVMGGAYPLYLDAYPLEQYSIYGAVPLRTIKQRLLELKRLGRLDRAKMLLLTNCTFDGIIYNPRRVMEEVLAIKPDMCFLWDEAWYAFAHFTPYSRERTAMYNARVLEERYAGEAYREEYAAWRDKTDALDPDDDATWLDNRLMPDPDLVRIRVYSTQSTHKSLSSLRQGSMIHIWDQDFSRKSAGAFDEAYLAHTSTSPNYQIIASLDLARRQADLEGYAMVTDVYNIADVVRQQIASDPLLSRYFRMLSADDLIPLEYHAMGASASRLESVEDFDHMVKSWEEDEFLLDPSRMTLYLAETGYNGNEFKVDVLMDRYDIQINKTSINSVLFIATIGVTWSSVAYLLDVLRRICEDLDKKLAECSSAELEIHRRKVESLTTGLPSLPDFSCFHRVFRPHPDSREGDMRSAYYLEYEETNREYVPLDDAPGIMEGGRELVSTSFVVPYPPGFPVLVPGQVVSPAIVEFMQKLDVKEIHGFRPELGLSVFTEKALADWGSRSG